MNEPNPPVPLSPVPTTAPFFSVSRLKFAVLAFTTFGLYEFYWHYRNWTIIRQRTAEPIMPFWRAFFGYFWIYSLLRQVRDYPLPSPAAEPAPPLPAGLIAIAWIVLTLLYKLPDPWWLVTLFAFVPLLAAQRRINWINAAAAPAAPLNDRFTWANWLWIAGGGILLVLGVIGTLMPDNG